MLRPWGLQKRIMSYVAVGLVLGFVAFFVVSMHAITRSTESVLDERLVIAENVAAELSNDIQHVSPDLAEQVSGFTADTDRAVLEGAANRALKHFTEVDRFAFFDVVDLWLVDAGGDLLAAAPAGSYRKEDSPVARSGGPGSRASRLVWPAEPGESADESRPSNAVSPEQSARALLFSAVVPFNTPAGGAWAYAVIHMSGRDQRSPFVPIGLRGQGAGGTTLLTSQYHLEVLAPSGTVVLGMGPDEIAGTQSPHYVMIGDWMAARVGGVRLHAAPDVNNGRPHIMAVAPVASSPLYLVLEQDRDVALAIPTEFRQQLLLFSVVGFLGALGVAWVTTRHVVRPTERLTVAAERMAGGELSTPIDVAAQDEVGTLARSLELMRQRLEHALHEVETANRELEARVRERTRQLQELVGGVIIAQEDERHRVALELHDETAQALTALTLTLDSIARDDDGAMPDVAERLREARQMSRTTLDAVRRLIHSLGPAALEQMGVVPALRAYSDEFLKPLSVEVQGALARMPGPIELALYRIGQEALNNVSRHARATHARVSLAREDASIVLVVTDDGVGFDDAGVGGSASSSKGLGIAGMRERARAAGGEMLMASAIGQGTTVKVEIPLRTDE